MQPFAQLSREVVSLTDEEKDALEIKRVEGLKLPTGKVLGLDNRGWRRGPPQDGGVVGWYEKQLANDLVACLELDPGIFTGMISEAPEQTLGKLSIANDGNHWQADRRKNIGSLSAIEASEMVRDLESLKP